ncbi:CPBP family intramembrane glutamic endopeptidase [Bacillus sp. 31A1R]|uniref:CPBP family intramembrane glutamic endopeptidase n=1 Tax=Robertmurraya mangrovi TaxID=3098077 RepID=A0ABU5J2Z2_9BACI|nr:CPBP family intramembrane glutamic endopeptidase [Bacillus sp. 31A1R]MDZ5473732.1 CPBP family intramembrane glutamic endopeptidase [Bacillus sp. 31A1R]
MILMTLIILFTVIIVPLLDVIGYKRIEREKSSKARMQFYYYLITIEWLIVGAIFLVSYLNGISMKELGFIFQFETISNFLYFIGGLLTSTIVLFFVLSRIPFYRKMLEKQLSLIEHMLPASIKERLVFALGAITAGICEEIIYRGFLFHYFSQAPFELSTTMIMIVTSVIFGLAHIYQGWKGVIVTGLVGFLMARFYVNSGTLIIPIILHIIIDLRFAVLPNLNKKSNTSIALEK